MVTGMNILRVGSFHGPETRYSRILDHNQNVRLTWLCIQGDVNVAKLYNNQHIKIISVGTPLSLCIRLLQKLAIKSSSVGFYIPVFYVILILTQFLAILNLKRSLDDNYDIIWIGNNDNDYSIALACALNKLLCRLGKLIWSYQEHRSWKRPDEGYLLKHVNTLIMPSRGSVNLLLGKYKQNIKNIFIANEDWRDNSEYKQVLRHKMDRVTSSTKIADGPTFCILTRFAEFGDVTKRRGDRINYVEFCRLAALRNLNINLNALAIVSNVGDDGQFGFDNPYRLLQQAGDLEITKPYDFTSIDGYLELSNNDYGILHNPLSSKHDKFDDYNVPNRFFEYLLGGVVPIVFRHQNPELARYCEEKELGVVVDNIDELSNLPIVNSDMLPNTDKLPNFSDFLSIIIDIANGKASDHII